MNLSVIDRHFSVKMVLYWPSSFRVSMNRDNSQVNEHAKCQYPALFTKQAWSIKYLLYGQKQNFHLQDQRGKSREQTRASLDRSGSQLEQNLRHLDRSRIQPYNKRYFTKNTEQYFPVICLARCIMWL